MRNASYTFTEKHVETRPSQVVYAPLITLYVPKEKAGPGGLLGTKPQKEPYRDGGVWRRAVHTSTGAVVTARQVTGKVAVRGQGVVKGNARAAISHKRGEAGDYVVKRPDGSRTLVRRSDFEGTHTWV